MTGQDVQDWALIDAYFRNRSFAKMEIDSFNQFLDKKLDEIVDESRMIVPKIEEVKIELEKIAVERPRIIEADGSPRKDFYPIEARVRNRTYSAPIYLTMKLLRRDVEQDYQRAYVGDMPIMLKSNRCWLEGKTGEELVKLGEDPMDFGGYFIINGSEKILITQEVLSPDRVLVSEQASEKIAAEVISTRGAFKGRVRIVRGADGLLSVTFPSSPRKLQLFVLLRALGLKGTKEILDAFQKEKEVVNDVLINLENLPVKSEAEALDRIGKFVAPGQVEEYRLRRAQEVIDAFLLPHIGQSKKDRLTKAFYLIMMATKSIERAHNLRKADDKDVYSNKRLELSGKLVEHLFRYAFKYFIKDLKFQVDRTVTRRRKLNISTIVRPGAISERIRFAMSTGNWIGRATGVSKFMDRVNYLSPLTDIRKVKSPLDKNRELYEARDVHGTHWGRLGPVETPDGPQCVSPDTQMLLDDYSAVRIGEFERMWKGKGVAAVDWQDKTEKNAGIARYVKLKPTSGVLKVKTGEGGRSITATPDHPFYSERLGKTALAELKPGDRVAVLPIKPLEFEKPEGDVILSEKDVLDACPEKSDRKYIVGELKKRGLLPLCDDSEKLLPLARLLGHMFGDGCMVCSMKKYKSNCTLVFSGEQGDLNEIAGDVAALGFKMSKITVWHKTSQLDNGRVISGLTTRADCYSKPLWVLMKALGAPVGDKTVNATSIPEWLKKQRKIVVKEFLAAYFGSEMTKPAINKRNGKVFLQPCFSLNKSKELTKKGVEFVEAVKELLERFGITLSQTKIVYGTKRKSGIETRKIKAMVASDMDSLLNLYGTVGFAYCAQRKSLARLAFAYLLEKKTAVEKRAAQQEMVLKLYKNGKGFAAIAEALSGCIRKHDAANWVKKLRRGAKPSVRASAIDFPRFNDWAREHVISENGLVWETIESIEDAVCDDVRDITTREHYHNFFANGFLTGNCGLVKNLAILAEVTTETEEAPVEKMLKDMGVKIG